MKRACSLLLTAALLASGTTLGASAAEPSYEGKTVILYTGNVWGDVDRYAQIKGAKDAYEAAGAQVILVDAGNYLRGSAAANTDRGAAIYDLMEAAGYDVAAMGLAEFSYTDATTGYIYHGNLTRYYTQAELQKGSEALSYNQNRDGSVTAQRAERTPASFRTVASNVTGAECYAFESDVVVTTGDGLEVLFYGLTDPSVEESVQDGFVTVAEPEARTFAADVVVCLSNAGVSGEGYGDILIDVPTGGALAVGAYVIDNATREVTAEEVDLSAAAADEMVAALAAEAKAGAAQVVGTSDVLLNGSDRENWNGETNLGDLVTDALVWYAENYVDGLDESLPLVAIQNGGNCDDFLYPGDITEVDLLKTLPFSPMGIGVLQVTGAQLLETIEAATQSPDCAGFAQVSGLTYTLDTTAGYDGGEAYGNFFVADSVNRVTITSVNGADFDPEAVYALVCDNFLLNGNDTYYTLKAAKEAEGAVYLNNGNGVKTRDVVAMYIDQVLGGTVGEEYAAPQGRITVLTFSDVKGEDYCFEAVNWAVEQGITNGTSETTFSPERTCTDAEILTFLWRAMGSPEPAGEFNDIYYYSKSTAWAAYEQITENQGDPDLPCTRATAVTYLWRVAGSPEAEGEVSFTDIPADAAYAQAVAWAVEQGITNGTSATTFEPDRTCTRGEIVTLLYRALGQ